MSGDDDKSTREASPKQREDEPRSARSCFMADANDGP